jgi:hypothetical protein
MYLEFTYDIERDIENWMNATKSVNNPSPTKMHLRYREECGEAFEELKLKEFIGEYLEAEAIDMEEKIRLVEDEWAAVKVRFLERAEAIFKHPYEREIINVFLTTDNRATYNLKGGYFFLSVHAKSPMLTIMHELFHFFTWQLFRNEVEGGNISKACYNDIKESLTVLLNVEFADLLAGAEDKGYPQHKEMRESIKKNWLETKDIVQVFESAKSLCK